MLVMRRRPGESIRIGPDVEIEIIECGPKSVKLGIRAPKEVPVWRTETAEAREQNIAAAAWADAQSVPSLAKLANANAGVAIAALVSEKL